MPLTNQYVEPNTLDVFDGKPNTPGSTFTRVAENKCTSPTTARPLLRINRGVLVTAGHIVALANELKAMFVRSNKNNAMNAFSTDLKEMMNNWNELVSRVTVLFPSDSAEQRFQRVKAEMDKSIGLN